MAKAYVAYRGIGDEYLRIRCALVPATPRARAGYIEGVPTGTLIVVEFLPDGDRLTDDGRRFRRGRDGLWRQVRA
jgi:hypothetical protein